MTTLPPCGACQSTAHGIQQCPQIARFDIEQYLREQLATCHDAFVAAMALVRLQSYGAVLDDALKENDDPLFVLRQRIEEIRADYPSDVFPGDVGKGARMAIDRVLALFAIQEATR